ncbi:MAG TPA: hypothetical protein VM143_00930 [Acidimicrobiales bacterium]|nr:hypothetical protein [Acidimicrobiales bacterium]
MIRLDAATVLLQWAVGGLLFLWVTTRRREVGLGYGWLLRGVFGVLAIGAVAAGRIGDAVVVRDVAAVGVVVASAVALAVSVVRRRAGVRGQREVEERRSARVAAMTGIDRKVLARDVEATEFPPWMDLVAPAVGAVGLVAAGVASAGAAADAGEVVVAVLRTSVGAAFLGAVTDAMLLGHWYLVQPGLARGPLNELNRWLALIWPFEVAALLLPTGMLSVLSGTVDDGYGGLLGWFWIACAVTTIVLTLVTAAALKERAYSAVMAATGLLYLAILTAFGTDLVARAVLSG